MLFQRSVGYPILLPTNWVNTYVWKDLPSGHKGIAQALEGRPVSVLNAAEDEGTQCRKQVELKKERIASVLSVLVLLREEVIGTVRLGTAELSYLTGC